ncbi:Cys-tRNA(Pro) deacylase [Enterococcus eurekensis]|uniref:Cys-tRNA(Pro)/Cys-tRNA(Cys) deacylase n=2 Tax=Enterococcus TaxID=1350 RepID=A0ABV9M2W9_9ENTE|nr:Cys-tRNA(Pro) deacylase [Candidatus Enterococcus avicola]
MAKKKENKTNALRKLEQQKISYLEHHYEWSEDHLGAEAVTEQLVTKNPAQIFKTLVAVGNVSGVIVAVIPSDRTLDLKKLAKASGNKRVEMLNLSELEVTTGYIRGGCSPVGMKKLFPTFLDNSASDFKTIIVSAGRRGLQMEVAPLDLVKVTKAQLVAIANQKS